MRQLEEQNIHLPLRKLEDYSYELEVLPNPWSQEPPLKTTMRLSLGLSGDQLIVRHGGGYYDFLEFLDKRGYLYPATTAQGASNVL